MTAPVTMPPVLFSTRTVAIFSVEGFIALLNTAVIAAPIATFVPVGDLSMTVGGVTSRIIVTCLVLSLSSG